MAVKSLIQTVTVGAGGAASIEFTDIPQDGVDLVLLVSARNSDSGTSDNLNLTFNSSSANLSRITLYGTGSASASQSGSDGAIIGGITSNGATANTFGNTELRISNYAGATNKSWSSDAVSENNGALVRTSITAGLWSQTTAISSISVAGGYDFLEHTTASLFKIKYD
jgi:hypothetical protein